MIGQQRVISLFAALVLAAFGFISQPAHAQCVPAVEGPFGAVSCSDWTDNDCDGLRDGADPDCYNTVGDPAVDDDGDGMTENAGDCDDAEITVYHDAPKICDGRDNNCDGIRDFSTDIDEDGDGAMKCTAPGGVRDCDDRDPLESPFLTEGPPGDPTCFDLRDNDCDGKLNLADPGCQNTCFDEDGDGFYSVDSGASCTQPKDDCDDYDPGVHPGASETTCNGIDNDCDGAIDEDYVAPVTNCGIGACAATGLDECTGGRIVDSCVPGTPGTEGPFGDPTCSDGLDNDCDGVIDDPPGICSTCSACCATGLPDNNCDGLDDDCNGVADDLYVAPVTSCGTGACTTAGLAECIGGAIVDSCVPLPAGTEGPPGDPTCTPQTPPVDEDCDGIYDMNDPDCSLFCPDTDGDGYAVCDGDCDETGRICGDCNDSDNTVYPGAPKICDGKDNNCDGIRDFSTDVDNDGDGAMKCTAPDGVRDCDDRDPLESPFLTEGPPGHPTCADLRDNDCDGKTNLADQGCVDSCIDEDGDGFYSVSSDVSCTQPKDDCDDSDPTIYPGAAEATCNGVDNDCDLAIDEDYVAPGTNCGIGACAATGLDECISGVIVDSCVPGTPGIEGPNGDPTCGAATGDEDCDGLANAADPDCAPCVPTGLTDDNCDGVDDDCIGGPDQLYVAPVTNCGIGACATTGLDECISGVVVDSCVPLPAGTEGPPGDPTCMPQTPPVDEDCDGRYDGDDPDCGAPCPDLDGDGYVVCDGICLQLTNICGECDDTDAAVYPGAPKICDGKDNNCDGIRDFSTDVDNDGDGAMKCTPPGGVRDCDDRDPNESPFLTEGPPGDPSCSDLLDNDCDGKINMMDCGCTNPCLDDDGDGYYSAADSPCSSLCTQPKDDCDDSDPGIHPGASETMCNGIDNDCDGTIDEDYVVDDTCGIGQCLTNNIPGSCSSGIETPCQPGPAGFESVYGSPECYDGIDNDCDGAADAADSQCQPQSCSMNADCGTGEFCEMPAGDCFGTGECMVRPTACPAVYIPVCGCDGSTYGNSCEAAMVGISVYYDGECTTCGGPSQPEGPPGDPTCTDGLDNDCDGNVDTIDVDCNSSYTMNITSGVAHTTGGITGTGMGDIPVSGLFMLHISGTSAVMEDIAIMDDPSMLDWNTLTGMLSGSTLSQFAPYTDPTFPFDTVFNGSFNGSVLSMTGTYTEPCFDCYQYDYDISAVVVIDNDADGYCSGLDPACTGANVIDCDDNDPGINPGMPEGPYGDATCSDTVDNDCDGETDSADPGCQPAACTFDGECQTGEYCAKPHGDCYGPGICTPLPGLMCTAVYIPVCGCDGVTYLNHCYADNAGVNIHCPGKCK